MNYHKKTNWSDPRNKNLYNESLSQENRRWREKANAGITGCTEEEEDEIKVLIISSSTTLTTLLKLSEHFYHIGHIALVVRTV